jgi:mRNA interferase RelE/StbE
MYRLTIRKQAIKTLQRMRARDALRVRGELDKLAQNPGRRDIDVTPLRGRPGLRLRVGPWRVIFERDEEARKIDVLRIGPRGDVYKELGGTP